MLMDDSTETPQAEVRITPRLIDSLYTEAMLLADEARSYFDEAGREERGTLEPFARVGFACESTWSWAMVARDSSTIASFQSLSLRRK